MLIRILKTLSAVSRWSTEQPFSSQKPLISAALSVWRRMQYQGEGRDKRKATFYLAKPLGEQRALGVDRNVTVGSITPQNPLEPKTAQISQAPELDSGQWKGRWFRQLPAGWAKGPGIKISCLGVYSKISHSWWLNRTLRVMLEPGKSSIVGKRPCMSLGFERATCPPPMHQRPSPIWQFLSQLCGDTECMSLTQRTWEVLLGAVPLCEATSPGGRMQISCRGSIRI